MTLDELPRDVPPPPGTERRVIERLRDEGLLAGRRRRGWLREGAIAAALAAAFALGWYAARLPASAGRDQKFMLLLYGGQPAPGDSAGRVDEYASWARELARSGYRVSGEKLRNPSRTIPAGAEPVAGSALGGFFIVDAAGMPEAVELAEQHPHVRHGGTIVVRQIDRSR